MDKFEYLAVIAGGIGSDVWDREITVYADNIKSAIEIIESDLQIGQYSDIAIVSIEQVE